MIDGRLTSVELGQRLRKIRKQMGVKGPHLLSQLMQGAYSPLGISRRESGKIKLDAQYLQAFCDALKINGKEREDLIMYAKATALRSQGRHAELKSEYYSLFQKSTIASIYTACVIPGTLQTLDYARAIMRAYIKDDSVDEWVQARVKNSRTSLGDASKRMKMVCHENSLYTILGGGGTMILQLMRLNDFEDLPQIEFRILPNHINLDIPLHESFSLIDEHYAICETRIGVMTSEDETTTSRLRQDFRTIWSNAAAGVARREIIARAIAHYRKMGAG